MSDAVEENGLSGYLRVRVSRRHTPLDPASLSPFHRRPRALLSQPPQRSRQAERASARPISDEDLRAEAPVVFLLVHGRRSSVSSSLNNPAGSGSLASMRDGRHGYTDAKPSTRLTSRARCPRFKLCARTLKMTCHAKTSHRYLGLGISRGDLQWIEVKRPRSKWAKRTIQGSPPSAFRNASSSAESLFGPRPEPAERDLVHVDQSHAPSQNDPFKPLIAGGLREAHSRERCAAISRNLIFFQEACMKRIRFRLRIGLAVFLLGLFNVVPFSSSALLAGLDQKVSVSCRISPEHLKDLEGRTPNAGPQDCDGGPGKCLLN